MSEDAMSDKKKDWDIFCASEAVDFGWRLFGVVEYLFMFLCKEEWYNFRGEGGFDIEIMVLYVGYMAVLSDVDVMVSGRRRKLLSGGGER